MLFFWFGYFCHHHHRCRRRLHFSRLLLFRIISFFSRFSALRFMIWMDFLMFSFQPYFHSKFIIVWTARIRFWNVFTSIHIETRIHDGKEAYTIKKIVLTGMCDKLNINNKKKAKKKVSTNMVEWGIRFATYATNIDDCIGETHEFFSVRRRFLFPIFFRLPLLLYFVLSYINFFPFFFNLFVDTKIVVVWVWVQKCASLCFIRFFSGFSVRQRLTRTHMSNWMFSFETVLQQAKWI